MKENENVFLHRGGVQQDSTCQHDRQHSFQVSTDNIKEIYVTLEHAHRESLARIRGNRNSKKFPLSLQAKEHRRPEPSMDTCGRQQETTG